MKWLIIKLLELRIIALKDLAEWAIECNSFKYSTIYWDKIERIKNLISILKDGNNAGS